MGDGIMLHRVMSAVPRFTFVPTNPNAAPGFTFINDGHGNWRIKFLTSGTLTFLSTLSHGIDVFLVGGGAGGVAYVGTMVATAGGGAGYTRTQKNVSVTRGTSYSITIGAGGAGKKVNGSAGSATGNNGGNTSAFGYTASGGKAGKAGYHYDEYTAEYRYNWADGGNGGSGGAPDVGGGGTGGTDGGNSQALWSHTTSGKGQKSVAGPNGETGTTREFGESSGTLYAQGGGTSTTATANSGNGGKQGNNAGSSGIVVIRNHRE